MRSVTTQKLPPAFINRPPRHIWGFVAFCAMSAVDDAKIHAKTSSEHSSPGGSAMFDGRDPCGPTRARTTIIQDYSPNSAAYIRPGYRLSVPAPLCLSFLLFGGRGLASSRQSFWPACLPRNVTSRKARRIHWLDPSSQQQTERLATSL